MAERADCLTGQATTRRDRALVVTATLVFVAQLWAQILWTPTGEGMDVYGHLAYVEFVAREGRAPRPDEASVPRDIVRLRDSCLTNAYLCPRAYAEWRALPAVARADRRAALVAEPGAAYLEPNYQAQHPVAYYWLMSWPYRVMRASNLDVQVTLLSLLSVAIAATAVPAFHLILASLLPRAQAWALVLVLVWFPNLMPFLGRITNDALAFPLAAWLVAIMSGAVSTRRSTRWSAVLLGLGCWTKTYFFTMVPVFLLWCLLSSPQAGEFHGSRWRRSVAALVPGVAWLLAFLAPLLALNLAHTGHLLPLLEAQRTVTEPLAQKVLALFALDPYWFLAGLARNFFWSGYWSFVSPHYLFYLPLATPLLLALVARPRPHDVVARVRELSLHVALLASFFAGLWWHAALFALDARLRGLYVHSGNEGYYGLVLLPSVALVMIRPWWDGLTMPSWGRALRLMVVGGAVWNLAARLAMGAFWGGAVPVAGRERLLDAASFAVAVVDPLTWTSWLSLPGVVGVSAWLAPSLLVAALALTARVLTFAADASVHPGPLAR